MNEMILILLTVALIQIFIALMIGAASVKLGYFSSPKPLLNEIFRKYRHFLRFSPVADARSQEVKNSACQVMADRLITKRSHEQVVLYSENDISTTRRWSIYHAELFRDLNNHIERINNEAASGEPSFTKGVRMERPVTSELRTGTSDAIHDARKETTSGNVTHIEANVA